MLKTERHRPILFLLPIVAIVVSCGPLITAAGFDSFTAPLPYDTSRATGFLEAAAVSMESLRDDKDTNIETIETTAASIMSAHPETDVIVFPELCTGWLLTGDDPAGYYRSVAEPIPGPSTDRIQSAALR